MLDPMTIRLAQTLSDERLKAAEQRRQCKNWGTKQTLAERMRLAIGAWVSGLRSQPKPSPSRRDVGLSR
jgi:hypothetical protein